MLKIDFSRIKKELEKDEELLFNDVKYFLGFVVLAILSTLIFYRQTQDEFTAALILLVLWQLFWRRSDLKGKVLLVLASVIGYAHEYIGVYAGFFTYLGGAFGGVPIWILPGYGAIFWASYNFWKVFEKDYSKKPWFSHINTVAALSFISFLLIDILWLGFYSEPLLILLKLMLAFSLFKGVREIRLAYFVAVFTVFNEIAGEFIGIWTHETFSIIHLMSGYVFLLWICLATTDIIRGTKKWRVIEVISSVALFILFLASVYLKIV